MRNNTISGFVFFIMLLFPEKKKKFLSKSLNDDMLMCKKAAIGIPVWAIENTPSPNTGIDAFCFIISLPPLKQIPIYFKRNSSVK